MSLINKIAFRQMDKEAQLAMILLPLAWVIFVFEQAVTHGTISLVQFGMGGLCCMLVFSYSNWGRWLSGIYNIFLVASMYWQGLNANDWPLMTIVISLVFAGSTIALFMPKTIDIFRKKNTMAPKEPSTSR